jgi:hypothetical protein
MNTMEPNNDPLLRLTTATLPGAGPSTETAATNSRVWVWFVVVCLLQMVGWTIWIVIASQHKVQEVPLQKVGRIVPWPTPAPQAS